MIIYNTKKRIIYDSENNFRPKRRLSVTEGKILMLLSDNALHTHKDMLEYMGIDKYEVLEFILEKRLHYIQVCLGRLRKKIRNYKELEIKARYKIGVNMEGDLWLE